MTGYVPTSTYNADQKRQDDIVGDWATAHPGQTISECVTSQETMLAEHAGQIAQLETDKADKSEIPDVTGYVPTSTYNAGQAEQDARITELEHNKLIFHGLFQHFLEFPNVEFVMMHGGVPSVTENYKVSSFVNLPYIRNDDTPANAYTTVNSVSDSRVFYFDGTTEEIPIDDITVHGVFRPGSVCLRADIPATSIPNLTENTPLLIHIKLSVTISTTAP